MEETKQDELKKEFEERFCKGKLNEFHPDISPYDICAWIASKINEAKEEKIEDYELALAEVSKVYCELTDNKLSKPNYKAEVILDEIRLQQEKDIEEAVNEQKQSIIEKIDDEIKKYDVLLESDEIYALTELKETITSKHSG